MIQLEQALKSGIMKNPSNTTQDRMVKAISRAQSTQHKRQAQDDDNLKPKKHSKKSIPAESSSGVRVKSHKPCKQAVVAQMPAPPEAVVQPLAKAANDIGLGQFSEAMNQGVQLQESSDHY